MKRALLFLVLLTLFTLVLRLAISFTAEAPSYESYATLLQAETIRETGLPRFHDALSYGGRSYAVSPAYYYLVALLTLFLPASLVLKLLPNILLVLLIPLAYLVGYAVTKNRAISLLTAFFAAFSPLLFTSYLNEAVPMTLALPVAVATLLGLLHLDERPKTALLLLALLILISPVAWLFLAAYALFLLILAAERIPISPRHIEAGLFAVLLAAWYGLITYKEALYRYGFAILSASLPEAARQASFAEFTLLSVLYGVGVVPLALGSLALYHNAFEQRTRRVFLIGSWALVALLVTAFRIVPLRFGLTLVSISFVLLSAHGLAVIAGYTRKTRFPALQGWIIAGLLLLFLLSSLFPAVAQGIYPQPSPVAEELEAMRWLRAETSPDALVAAAPQSGFLLNHEARRAYIADTAYLLIPNPDGILGDIDLIYTTPSTVAATERLGRYKATHILIGPREHARYPEFGAIMEDPCFPTIYETPRVAIKAVNCTLSGGAR